MLDEEKIRGLLASGEHWKAKEMVQGKLSGTGYNPELFESYGYVLLSMNDSLEAGKYLFLSGSRKDEYSVPIGLFLERYGGDNIQHIYHTFPKRAQSSSYDDYPGIVKQELNELGYKLGKTKKTFDSHGRPASAMDKIIGCIMISVFILLIIGFLVGAFNGIKYLWNLMIT